jgi:hypothetical protein
MAPYHVSFHLDRLGAHLLVSWLAGGVLKHFFQEFHQMPQSNLLAGLLSWVLESVVFLARVNLFLQRDDSAGQPVGGHTDSSQVVLFHEIDLVGQVHDLGELKWGRFFTPRPLKFKAPANKRREAGFVILAVEPCPVQSPKVCLHRKVQEAGAWAGLETHATDNLAISDTLLVFQEKVILDQRKIR